jgi:hypothetical protein
MAICNKNTYTSYCFDITINECTSDVRIIYAHHGYNLSPTPRRCIFDCAAAVERFASARRRRRQFLGAPP